MAVAFGIFNDPHHRHPTQSQRASVATELAADERQQPLHAQICAPLREGSAELLNAEGIIGMFRNAVVERIKGVDYR